jgi:hypothetical protein
MDGSTLVARHAGTQQEMAATAASSAIMPIQERLSRADVLKSRDEIA